MAQNISFSPRVIELLASKICHDLVSPVGAISNGVEFWQEMGEESAEESMGLIAHSASQAALGLQTFRLAYGAGGSEKHIGLSDINKAISAYLDTERHKITWDINNEELDGILPIGFCKTLLNVLILIADITPKGANITLTNTPNKADVKIEASADMVRLKDGYQDIIDGQIDDDALDARNVHPHIMMLLAAHYDLKIGVETSETSVTVQLCNLSE